MVDGVGEQDQRRIRTLNKIRHFQQSAEGLPQTHVHNGLGDRGNLFRIAPRESRRPGLDEPKGLCKLPVAKQICSVFRWKIDVRQDLVVVQDVMAT